VVWSDNAGSLHPALSKYVLGPVRISEELAQYGARREAVPHRYCGARRTLCAFEATDSVPDLFVPTRHTSQLRGFAFVAKFESSLTRPANCRIKIVNVLEHQTGK
jgi:hypothetical protein